MNTDKTPSPDWFDRHFQSVVMGLLLCIVLALSVLWLRERNRRIDAELELHSAQEELFVLRTFLERQLPALSPETTTQAQSEHATDSRD